MKILKPPQPLDLARFSEMHSGKIIKEVVALHEHWPPFNYQSAEKLIRLIFEGRINVEAAISTNDKMGSPIGRPHNASVIQLVSNYALGRSYECYAFPYPTYFELNQSLRVKMSPPFYFVENGRAKIFCLNGRKTCHLSQNGQEVLMALLNRALLTTDFKDAEIVVFDTSAPSGPKQRQLRILRSDSVSTLTDAELKHAIEPSVEAYDYMLATGYSPRPQPPQEDEQNLRLI